jgi:YihY family inner membrane protein
MERRRPSRPRNELARVVVRGTLRRFVDARGFDLSASLAYAALLTVVPLVVSVTLLTSVFFGTTGTGLYRVMRWAVPGVSRRLVTDIQSMARHAASLTGFASVFFLITSLRTFFLIEGSAKALWGTTVRRPFRQRLFLAASVMVIAPGIAGVITSFLLESGASFSEFRFVGLLLTAGLLTFLYRILPGGAVRFRPALIAGLAAATGLTLLRMAFGRGIASLANVSRVYGSISASVIFVLAIGFVFTIFLLGVSLAHALQFSAELQDHDQPPERTEESGPLYNAVRLLMSLAVAWQNDRASRTPRALADELGRTEADVEAALATFRSKGLISGVPGPEVAWTLSRPPDQISLYAVARAIGESSLRPVPAGDDPVALSLREVFSKANREERGVLQGTSLQDLLPVSE